MKWVEGELRLYLCRDLRKEDIEMELELIDEDVSVPTSRLSHMPRQPFRPSSAVEREVLNREEARKRLYDKLRQIERHTELIEKALTQLSPLEKQVIHFAYFSVEYVDDIDIAKKLGVSLGAFNRVKHKALFKLSNQLRSDKLTA